MATDFELAHQGHVFNYDPSRSRGFLTQYANCRLQNTALMQHYRNHNNNNSSYANRNRHDSSPTRQHSSYTNERKPGRPCLVNRSDDSNSGNSSGDETESAGASPIRQKKKVVFADDRGLSLTQVRMMIELPHVHQPFRLKLPSFDIDNVQPINGSSLLNHNNEKSNQAGENLTVRHFNADWKLTFNQPASNYLDFRNNLDRYNVSLENIIIKYNHRSSNNNNINDDNNNNDKEIVGTVKVKNLCYEKSVFVRTTTDNWITHNDVVCTFVNQKHTSNSIIIIYDTFAFNFPLSSDYTVIEFCVCFHVGHREYWDNNDGKNYKLVKNQTNRQFGNISVDTITGRRQSLEFRSRSKSRSWPEFDNRMEKSSLSMDGSRRYW